MITTLGEDIPGDIRRAVEGSLKGWHRLRRFQVAMAFPTIEAAAAHLGAHQSALIHQFRRLEQDIGGTLYHRSAPGQPMRPTQRGAALLTALARPDIQAAAARHAPDVSGPPGSNGRYRERMPPSTGSRTADAQQAARLFRALAEPTRLAILLTLQDGERRITDLATDLGGSQTGISSHVTSLKESGLITGRPQGRPVYTGSPGPNWTPCWKLLRRCSPQPASASGYIATTVKPTERRPRGQDCRGRRCQSAQRLRLLSRRQPR